MEFVLMFGGLIALLVFMLPEEHSKDGNPDTSETAVVKRSEQNHAPCEAKSSKPQVEKSVIEGAAYIIDGDSLVIKKTQIRLFGVDAPELNHPYGKKAKWALLELSRGQTIRAEIDHADTYGRSVAKCFLPDGTDLSAEMVKIGLAIDWPKYSGGRYRPLEASDARRKMWLADARQKGQMHVWEKFEMDQKNPPSRKSA